MKIQLLSFAAFRDFLPNTQTLELESSATVADLKNLLKQQYPELTKLLGISRVSINQSIVAETEVINDGAIIALLPPSSGG
ncbi:MoaD/ThiS family protein [Leptospira sp. 96542]|nr:MoaD/ThiS family protein [Leptospira sp. 96542]